jgi:hypothetical protein
MSEPEITLDDIGDLIQKWINQRSDEAIVITGAMLVWEQARYTDDGEQARKFGYADVLHSGLAAAVGLMVAGQRQVMDDLFGEPDGDED